MKDDFISLVELYKNIFINSGYSLEKPREYDNREVYRLKEDNSKSKCAQFSYYCSADYLYLSLSFSFEQSWRGDKLLHPGIHISIWKPGEHENLKIISVTYYLPDESYYLPDNESCSFNGRYQECSFSEMFNEHKESYPKFFEVVFRNLDMFT